MESDMNCDYFEGRNAFIPILENYDISPETGFLPSSSPLDRLPCEFDAWEALLADYKRNMPTAVFREVVDFKLPTLHIPKELSHSFVHRRAFHVLSFITSVYVWGRCKGDTVLTRLPPQLAVPLCSVANALGVCPITSYPGICLWNFRYIAPSTAHPLERIAINETFTGTVDEEWFYTIPLAIELVGAKILRQFSRGWRAAVMIPHCTYADATLTFILCSICETVLEIKRLLSRMGEKCNPNVFYNNVRRFVTGWHATKDASVIYEAPMNLVSHNWLSNLDTKARAKNDTRSDHPVLQFAGASAGQSSIIQAIDVFLGIDHFSSGKNESKKHSTTEAHMPKKPPYHYQMRNYMPELHRKFLDDCESKAPSIREAASRGSEKLRGAYESAVSAVLNFRSYHMGIATRYIVKQQNLNSEKKEQAIGTGGTDLIMFLNSMRKDTRECISLPRGSPNSENTSFESSES